MAVGKSVKIILINGHIQVKNETIGINYITQISASPGYPYRSVNLLCIRQCYHGHLESCKPAK